MMTDHCKCPSKAKTECCNSALVMDIPLSLQKKRKHRRYRFQFHKHMKYHGTSYQKVTSMQYLLEKYGEQRAATIMSFVNCIHKKINRDVSRIDDSYINNEVSKWAKSKLFLLLVTLSQRGGPEYWMDKNNGGQSGLPSKSETQQEKKNCSMEETKSDLGETRVVCTLVEQIMRENITADYDESVHDENYVFSTIWANFMEGLINHYLEKVIIPGSELKVCQQLYKPMMKIISLYNEYNELMEKSERNGFLPTEEPSSSSAVENGYEGDRASTPSTAVSCCTETTDSKLEKAQKLLWQARQDIPKTISKELTLLSEMYSTLSADEQDYELDEFVCCAEEYIEMEYLPALIDLLFLNCGRVIFWKVMLVLEPFFYYIEEIDENNDPVEEDEEEDASTINPASAGHHGGGNLNSVPDPRVVTLEKICEVAARQKWI
ncbi:HDR145Wp [Eremothecium sinecaudum]|uniref:HDR145Wp n=1 Tax=Eremothecium sinecaudum TaxID=45286 RepID=A0A0X8HSV2_9SACH|nr:HDR145Wp [Eremothecium sinecaudum]AMD20887.1 HDR145Wp [Eremothecium sinecaudum]